MLLSICIPTYNRPEYLKNCLTSICAQKSKDFEVCISDNASNIDIYKIIKPFKKKIKIRYRRNKKNMGLAMNVYNVALMAKGEFIWFLGDDDLVTNGSIIYLLKLIKRNKKINFLAEFILSRCFICEQIFKKFNIKYLPKNLKPTHH